MTRPSPRAHAIAAVAAAAALAVACGPRTARDIVDRSLAAHGGAKLSQWKTLTIKGTVDLWDGNMYTGEYVLLAEAPGRLRVEQNMTGDIGGRFFYEYFLNDGVAWSRRNLIVGQGNLGQMQRWLRQCAFIAHYAERAESLTRLEDGMFEWKERPTKQSQEYQVVATRPVFVIRALVGTQVTELAIDRESLHLLQESGDTWKRAYWDFKDFGGVVLPSKVNDVTIAKNRESITPYIYKTVEYDAPIEAWLFSEEMPKK
jgi:hypothetical protein